MNNKQPDWGKIAEKFDLWLPHIAPVGEKILSCLDIKPGYTILDVATGTGEPALTIANRYGSDIQVVGTDAAEGMVKVARDKAINAGLSNIKFETMAAEKLNFDDNSFDIVICRFGAMLFEDSQEGLTQMCRVLKPGGQFALAVWSTPQTMPIMFWSYHVFKDKIPDEHLPPLAKMTSLSAPNNLDGMLAWAGFNDFTIEEKSFHYSFSSFDDYWDTVEASEILKQQFDALPSEQRVSIRDEVRQFAEEFVSEQGFSVPHKYLLVSGSK